MIAKKLAAVVGASMLSMFVTIAAEAVNVRDFGAVGDGVHDDTLAIQKAADSLYARAPGSAFGEGKWEAKRDMWCLRDRYMTGSWDGPNGELFFPKGVYRVSGPVMLYWSVNLRGEEGAVIRNERPDRDCFYFDHAFRSSVEGLTVEGGRRQLVFWTNNRSDSTLLVSRCAFRNAADVAMVSYCRRLKSDPVVNAAGRVEGRSPYVISRSAEGLVALEPRDENQLASVPNSTLIVIEECSFEDNARAFDLSSDGVLVRDSRVRARADSDGSAASVGCQAHIDNVRFELTGSVASTNRCILQCGGHTMLVSGSAFTSEVPVPAIRYVGKPCSVRAGCQLRIKDLMLGNGSGPVIRFAAEAFPDLLVIDGLNRKDGEGVLRRIFDFERTPTAEEVAKWPANSKTLKSGWPHPVMAAEACLGVSAGRFDPRQFDASLPAALEPFRRPFDDVRCRFSSRLEIAVPARTVEGAEVVVSGGRPTMDPKGDDGDDTEALLSAARQVSEKAGSVLVLPANWLRTKKAIPLSGRMRVTVRGRAVLTADDAAPAFEVAEGSDIVFENVIFRRGRNAVRCLGGSGRLGFRNCTFCDQLEASICPDVGQKTDWRIEVTGGSADTPHLYRGAVERMRIDGFWYTVAADRPAKSYAPSFVAIENLPGGKLELRDVLGVPRYFEPDELYEWKCQAPRLTGDYRWVDNRGFLRVLQSRFGGERGGLTPLYAATGAVSYVEGAIASHYNRHLASQGASAVVADPAKVTYVDVVGFNFEAPVHTTLRTRSASGEESVTQKGVFNCYPFDGPVVTNITVRPVDDGRALRNPDCGWVMHYYDNGAKYGTSLATGDSMSWYPSCNVVYLRLPWSWLEPEEGVYNWQAIDTPAQQWIDRGGQVAFRITVSETMRDGATPAWMLKSGAKIVRWNWVEGPKADGRFWECAPDDPIFLEKFGNFLKAMAARYDGRREVAFVDVGSLGIWGEGHTQRTIRLSEADTDRIARLHTELHLRHFRRTPVVVGDDFTIGTRKTQTSPMMDWALAQGLAWRDDSIIVGNPNDPDYPDSDWWYHEKQGRAFSEKAPVILEFGHYQTLKGWNNWNVEKLAEAVEKHRASYLSIHGNPHEILRENKTVVEALARRVGYRFQVREVAYPSLVHTNPDPSKARPFSVTFAVANAGAAPCYRDLYPCLTFKTPSGGIAAVLADSGFNLKSLPVAPPGQAEAKSHTASFALGRWSAPVISPDGYDVFLSIGEADGTPVCELPMAADDGKRRYRIGCVAVVL